MIYLLFGLVALALLLGASRLFVNADPAVVARVVRTAGGLVAGVLGVLLLLRGQFMFGAPLLMMSFGALGAGGLTGGGRARQARESVVETATVRMTLDHRSGRMDGEVRTGPHAGARLSDLDQDAIDALLAAAEQTDPDGAALLRTYRRRRFGQDGAGGAGAGDGAGGGSGEMSVAEAYAVLGLDPSAKAEDVRAAHRRLMKQAHPDRGGSAWLAAKINRAKEVLLARR
ncbi:MAG: DnaJ domain-containing protein [Caulobacterales bacterium]|nr:DnaJ domain-containing protein [Caulobacterales bacterium]